MNQILKYASVITAFAAGTIAFATGSTWAGVLAIAAGILVAVTIIRKDTKE
ncbi:hypothetical protein MUN78_16510 [Leucobacter allii]|uniref:Uncharacterized protein n=1 Tax=Leucobacter allii TaxID=2932247 RepID=A0ABY4FLW5_9MICO|nr:hypothetical protein [Leucobacter allii]UOQ57233.1 hypothetical protein MUN78_16510 [Leucobacter allii]